MRRGADQVRRSSAPTAGRTDGYVVIGYATRKKIFFAFVDLDSQQGKKGKEMRVVIGGEVVETESYDYR